MLEILELMTAGSGGVTARVRLAGRFLAQRLRIVRVDQAGIACHAYEGRKIADDYSFYPWACIRGITFSKHDDPDNTVSD